MDLDAARLIVAGLTDRTFVEDGSLEFEALSVVACADPVSGYVFGRAVGSGEDIPPGYIEAYTLDRTRYAVVPQVLSESLRRTAENIGEAVAIRMAQVEPTVYDGRAFLPLEGMREHRGLNILIELPAAAADISATRTGPSPIRYARSETEPVPDGYTEAREVHTGRRVFLAQQDSADPAPAPEPEPEQTDTEWLLTFAQVAEEVMTRFAELFGMSLAELTDVLEALEDDAETDEDPQRAGATPPRTVTITVRTFSAALSELAELAKLRSDYTDLAAVTERNHAELEMARAALELVTEGDPLPPTEFHQHPAYMDLLASLKRARDERDAAIARADRDEARAAAVQPPAAPTPVFPLAGGRSAQGSAVSVHAGCLHEVEDQLAVALAAKDAGYREATRWAGLVAAMLHGTVHPDADPASPGYSTVMYVQVPTLDRGLQQVSRHVADADVPLLAELPRSHARVWDGHDVAERNMRLFEATALYIARSRGRTPTKPTG